MPFPATTKTTDDAAPRGEEPRATAPRHYTTGELAKVFGVSQHVVYSMLERGLIGHFRLPGSSRRYVPRSAVSAYLETLNAPDRDWFTARMEWLDKAIAGQTARRDMKPNIRLGTTPGGDASAIPD